MRPYIRGRPPPNFSARLRALRVACRICAPKTLSPRLDSKILPSPRLVYAYAWWECWRPCRPSAPRACSAALRSPCHRRPARAAYAAYADGMGSHGGHGRSQRAWEVTVGIGSHGGHGWSRRALHSGGRIKEAEEAASRRPLLSMRANTNAARVYELNPSRPQQFRFKRNRES